MSRAEDIEATLRKSGEAMSIDEICAAVWKRSGDRERNLVRVTLHRLDERGLIKKYAQRYKLLPRT